MNWQKDERQWKRPGGNQTLWEKNIKGNFGAACTVFALTLMWLVDVLFFPFLKVMMLDTWPIHISRSDITENVLAERKSIYSCLPFYSILYYILHIFRMLNIKTYKNIWIWCSIKWVWFPLAHILNHVLSSCISPRKSTLHNYYGNWNWEKAF